LRCEQEEAYILAAADREGLSMPEYVDVGPRTNVYKITDTA
jgi:hypothetical protein